jgi:hypothetical protein
VPTNKSKQKKFQRPITDVAKKKSHHHPPAGGSEDPEAAFDAAVARQNAHLETALSRAEVRFFCLFALSQHERGKPKHRNGQSNTLKI